MTDEALREIFAKNLRRHMQKNHVSQADLARYMGVSTTTAARWYNGKAIPRIDKIQSICVWLGVKKTDLLEVKTHPSDPEMPAGYARLPVLGNIAAGVPITQVLDASALDDGHFEDFYTGIGREKDYFALRIKGDSMTPTIPDGSVVIVRLQPDAENGEVVVARVNGDEGVCKRLRKYRDGIALESMNEEYAPMTYKFDAYESCPVTILGKVVEVRIKL